MLPPCRYRDVAAQRRDQAVIEREESLGRLLVSRWRCIWWECNACVTAEDGDCRSHG